MMQISSSAFRQALLDAYDWKCFYCKEQITLENMEVDHIIPESVESKPEEEKKVYFSKYGLREDYDVNAIENLAPSCHNHNNRKSDLELNVGAINILLASAKQKATKVKERYKVLQKDKSLSQILAMTARSLDSGKFNLAELHDAFRKRGLHRVSESSSLSDDRSEDYPKLMLSRAAQSYLRQHPLALERLTTSLVRDQIFADRTQPSNPDMYAIRVGGFRVHFQIRSGLTLIQYIEARA